MSRHQESIDYYAGPGALTEPGRHADRLGELPADVKELVAIVHQLGIYDVVARDFYGVDLSEERGADIHLRSAEAMLDQLFAIDSRALSATRAPHLRIGCRCHAFTKLIVTLLRAKGVAARSRCGFATYFNPGRYEDHWVCEYWNEEKRRWVFVDAQLDGVWQEKLGIDWDVFDVPDDRFIVAADAWTRCREGRADPEQFGISFHEGMRGLWFIAGNLIRDAAALNKTEMLPWDVWGAAPGTPETFTEEQRAFYDRVATITRRPDDTLEELRSLYMSDERLRVPATVFNNLRQQPESVESVQQIDTPSATKPPAQSHARR